MLPQLKKTKISKSTSIVRTAPHSSAKASNELLYGESIQVLEYFDEWSKIRSEHDDYEGFVESADYAAVDRASTHWVITRASHVFEQPDIKSSVVRSLSFCSQLTVSKITPDGKFYQLDDVGFIWAAHCTENTRRLDGAMINTAQQKYLQTPYLWGGRSTGGCDCSGLVQTVAIAHGIKLPRDSGDQETALTTGVDFHDRAADDLVFWPGHVGILQSSDTLLHATAHSMRCCVEPLENVIQRAGSPSSIKRFVALRDIETDNA